MKFRICWPRHSDENLKDFADALNEKTLKKSSGSAWIQDREKHGLYFFYENLKSILEEKNIEYEIVNRHRYKILHAKKDEITISYHCKKNVKSANSREWIAHTSGSPGYFTLDQCGYAGFSKFTHDKNLWEKYLDEDSARSALWFKNFSKNYIQNNISRSGQANIEHISLEEPFIFIPAQLSFDSVLQLTKVKGNDFYTKITEHAEKNGYKVVYKPHPGEKTTGRKQRFKAPPNAIVSHESIHSLISKASAVVTINSGVGLEALLHEKPVYTLGRCDYEFETQKIKNLSDIENIDFSWKPDIENIHKLVYHLHNTVYVDCYNLDSMRKKIDYILECNQL